MRLVIRRRDRKYKELKTSQEGIPVSEAPQDFIQSGVAQAGSPNTLVFNEDPTVEQDLQRACAELADHIQVPSTTTRSTP